MSAFRFIICAPILVVFSLQNSEGYPRYASAKQIYSTNSNSLSNNCGANNCGANNSISNNSISNISIFNNSISNHSISNNSISNNSISNNSVSNNSISNNSLANNSSNADCQSLVFKSAFNRVQCLTIDNENASSQIIIDRCVPLNPGLLPIWRRTPRKLEVSKVKGTNRVQISQGFRLENQPFGLAGCLIPENGGVYASGHSCNYKVAYWGMKKIDGYAKGYQLIHISSRRCLTFPESGNGVTTSICDPDNVKQLWDVTE